jgi:hypothetical protein
MRKAIEAVTILVCLCLPSFAQNPNDCRADLQHLTLPGHAFIDDLVATSSPPVVFAFSQGGIDVYSATDFKMMQIMQSSGMELDDTITVILVYQNEQARQRKIASLRHSSEMLDRMIPVPHAPLANLKFEAVYFKLTPVWVNDVLTRKWLISQMHYFEPPACTVYAPGDAEAMVSDPPEPHLKASATNRNWILGHVYLSERDRISPAGDPLLVKALEGMRAAMKDFGLPY